MLKISIEVNRNVFVSYEDDPIVKCEFNDFSGISLRAYGATIFFKTILLSGKVRVNFFSQITYCPTARNHHAAFRIVRKLDFSPFVDFCRNCYMKGVFVLDKF